MHIYLKPGTWTARPKSRKLAGFLNLSQELRVTNFYEDNAAAIAGGLLIGEIYSTAAGDLKVVLAV